MRMDNMKTEGGGRRNRAQVVSRINDVDDTQIGEKEEEGNDDETRITGIIGHRDATIVSADSRRSNINNSENNIDYGTSSSSRPTTISTTPTNNNVEDDNTTTVHNSSHRSTENDDSTAAAFTSAGIGSVGGVGGGLIVAQVVEEEYESDTVEVVGDDEQEQAALRLRERILQDAVEAQVIKIGDENNDDGHNSNGEHRYKNIKTINNNNTNSKMRTKTVLVVCFSILLLIVLCGVLFGNHVVVLQSKGGGGSDADRTTTTTATVMFEEVVRGTLKHKYYHNDHKQDHPSDDSSSSSNPFQLMLNDPTSSQYKAYQWMVNVDEFFFNGYEDDVVAVAPVLVSDPEEEEEEEVDEISALLVERYVLGVLYYSTDGPSSWNDQVNFLNTTSSVCEWITEIRTSSSFIGGDGRIGIPHDDDDVEPRSGEYYFFEGVECDEKSSHITGLQLSECVVA